MNVIVNAIDLRNTSTVLLQAPHYMKEDELLELRQILEREFPHVKFVLLSGEFQLLAQSSNYKVKIIEGSK